MRTTLCVGVVVPVLIWSMHANAVEPGYLDELPEIPRVLADMQGKYKADTYARQAAALYELSEVVLEMAGERQLKGKLTVFESRASSQYKAAADRVVQ